ARGGKDQRLAREPTVSRKGVDTQVVGGVGDESVPGEDRLARRQRPRAEEGAGREAVIEQGKVHPLLALAGAGPEEVGADGVVGQTLEDEPGRDLRRGRLSPYCRGAAPWA